jgi:L-threonylcarbamoyladenylate synthase
MRRLPAHDPASIEEAVRVLRAGGLVAYPTETVYGVAADAADPEAVSRLLAFKNRPAGKAVSLLVSGREMAGRYVTLTDEAERLYAAFLPGPLTVVSKSLGTADSRLESELGTLGIRISSNPVAQTLSEAFGSALTATSANASGAARPYSIDTALSGLSERQAGLLDLALDAGQLPRNEPSSVVDTTQEVQTVVRAGGAFLDIAPPFHSHSEDDTRRYARDLVKSLLHVLPERPLVLALEGDLGAGKTQFAKGVAEALNVLQPVTSPTYALVKEYEGDHRLVHADLWRLTEARPEDLMLEEYLRPGTLLAIEWASPVLPYLGGLGYRVLLEPVSETERTIKLSAL